MSPEQILGATVPGLFSMDGDFSLAQAFTPGFREANDYSLPLQGTSQGRLARGFDEG